MLFFDPPVVSPVSCSQGSQQLLMAFASLREETSPRSPLAPNCMLCRQSLLFLLWQEGGREAAYRTWDGCSEPASVCLGARWLQQATYIESQEWWD